jgi:L-alanine-DL-glutamate epimerase-like enolase superfamily enzyme
LFDMRRMLDAQAVDVMQIDGTRCGGFTGFLRGGALCEATPLPCSAHTSPTLHAHVCCCVTPARHVEYFHDHVRVERIFFDGVLDPVEGMLRPDAGAPGLGITPRWDAMEKYLEWRSHGG